MEKDKKPGKADPNFGGKGKPASAPAKGKMKPLPGVDASMKGGASKSGGKDGGKGGAKGKGK